MDGPTRLSELHGTIYVWEAMAIVHEHNRYHSAGSATNDPFSQIFATPGRTPSLRGCPLSVLGALPLRPRT